MDSLGYYDQETSPYPDSDYTQDQGTQYLSLRFPNAFKNLTIIVATGVIYTILKIQPKAQKIADYILAFALGALANSSAIYYTHREYWHKNLGQFARRIFQKYYYYEDYTGNVPGTDANFYRIWM